MLVQVKELEQKLELERSSARRHESQISRLRHQLERLQGEKTEDVSHKSSDALNRSQKQIRELRAELQEAERKEQEMAKRRRNAVSSGHSENMYDTTSYGHSDSTFITSEKRTTSLSLPIVIVHLLPLKRGQPLSHFPYICYL